jgi:hypothetical protein
LAFIEESEMSIQAKLVGSCDALLLVLVGALHLGLFAAFVDAGRQRSQPVAIDGEQAHVEVVVVEASKIARS